MANKIEVNTDEDYLSEPVPQNERMGKFGLTMAWWALCSAMFWLMVPATVPARFVWTRFCNSGRLSHGISLTGFEG